MEVTDEQFRVLLRCVTRAPSAACRLMNICTACADSVREEMIADTRDDLRHRLMVRLAVMEEDHEYRGHEQPQLALADDDSEAQA